MKKITTTTKTYEGNNNEDYIRSVRELDTAKKVSDILAECEHAKASYEIYKKETLVDLNSFSGVKEVLKLMSTQVLCVEYEITSHMKTTAEILNSKMFVKIRI